MAEPTTEKATVGPPDPADDVPTSIPSRGSGDGKAHGSADEKTGKGGVLDPEIAPAVPDDGLCDTASEDVVIVTGADAAAHLLPLRDDFEPALTFRSMFLASCLSCFQAVMSQIYQVRFPATVQQQTLNELTSSNTQLIISLYQRLAQYTDSLAILFRF